MEQQIYFVEVTEEILYTCGETRRFIYYQNSEAAQKAFIRRIKNLHMTSKQVTNKGVAQFNEAGLLCPISW